MYMYMCWDINPLTSSSAVTVFLQWDILVVKLEAVGDL